MEEMTIVYFIVDKEGQGRQKRRGEWQYVSDYREVPVKAGRIKLITVRLPAWCYRKRKWKEADWQAYLRGLTVPAEGRETAYLFAKEAAAALGRPEEPLSLEWQLFLIAQYQIAFTSLVILDDRELETEGLIEKYVQRTRYIGIVTPDEHLYRDMQETLLAEYGFLLDVSASFRGLRMPRKGKTLLVAGQQLYDVTPARLSAVSWVSTDIAGEAGKGLCARAGEARYIGLRSLFADVKTVFAGKRDT